MRDEVMKARLAVIFALALGTLFGPLAADAQQSEKVHRIGLFDYGAPEDRPRFWNAFRQGMREPGYVEGQNIRYEQRWGRGDSDRLPELLRIVAPHVSRVAILWDERNPGNRLSVQESQVAARTLGLTLKSVSVRTPADLDAAFAALVTDRAAALSIPASNLFAPHRERLAELAMKHRLPTVSGDLQAAEAGLLASYGVEYSDLSRRAATFVDKILKGAKPGDLPMEQPTRFELVINLKTAKALGLTIPPSLLQRADQVIQ